MPDVKAEIPKVVYLPGAAESLAPDFEAIIESSEDAILSKDLNGIIRSWNPAAEKIFGYKAEEIVGKSVTLLIPTGIQDEEPAILSRIRRGEKINHYETTRQRKDGTLLNISLSVSPIKDASGTIVGASKIARDITAQKKAEQVIEAARSELAELNEELERRVKERTNSLKQAVAQMEEFSYSVSHDLRSPVRAMQAYAAAVLEDYGSMLDATGREHLGKIVRNGTQMDKLILDLLTYSKVARDQLEIKPVAPASLLEDIVQNYEEMQLPNASIQISVSIPPVMAHEPSLVQVFSNLLSNAVKFVAPGIVPQISLRGEKRDEKVIIWIEDNGIGIPASLQSRIFGLFERGNQDASYEGTGIGLAIVKKAVERMNGKIGIAPDRHAGTAFWIELPAAPEKPPTLL